ncbi:MAG: DUF2752 domain-containing protein [Akkermansiaceae bacterium]
MKTHRLWPLIPAGVVLGGMYFFVALADGRGNSEHSSVVECGVRNLTGFHCPGCGGTRCAENIIGGDWISAMAYNPLLLCGFLIFMSVSLYLIVRITILGKPSPKTPNIRPKWIWLGVAGIALFTVLRNIPAYPFTLLAP